MRRRRISWSDWKNLQEVQCEIVAMQLWNNRNTWKKWNYDSEIIGIDIPVVAVMGIGQNVQKFDLQLYLRSRFIDKGYKVSQIGTKK